MSNPKIKRVLVSVTDKTGVADFARALVDEFGAEIISTGGTARALKEAGVPVTPIDDVTQFPEMMDGRVKTLHPRVHGGLLAKRDNAAHMAAGGRARHPDDRHGGGEPLRLREDGGQRRRLRHLHREHRHRRSVDAALRGEELRERGRGHATRPATTPSWPRCAPTTAPPLRDTRAKLALRRVPDHGGLRRRHRRVDGRASWRARLRDSSRPSARCACTKAQDLRYGENPHQAAAFYRRDDYAGAEH